MNISPTDNIQPPSPIPSPFPSSSSWEEISTPTHTLRKKGLSTQLPPLATASMGDIEQILRRNQQLQLEAEVKQIQQKNSQNIKRRRTSSFKDEPKGDVQIAKVIEDLPKVRETLGQSLPNLLRRATTAPGNICHVKKKSISDNHTGYGITFCTSGQTYIHIPDSVFAYGGEAEVKLALNAFSEEIVVVAKKLDDTPTDTSGRSGDELRKVLGERRVMGRCAGCKNLAIPYAVTYKNVVEESCKQEILRQRYVYTISPYFSGGDLDGKYFLGSTLYEIALGLASGLHRMHHEGLVHRDLKPENMFYDGEVARIADFGTVGAIEDIKRKNDAMIKKFTRITDGTEAYKPPETDRSLHKIDVHSDTLQKKEAFYELEMSDFERRNTLKFAKAGDIFSFGVSLFQLSRPICDPTLPRSMRHMELVDTVTAFRRGPRPEAGLDALLYQMLLSDPERRPTIDIVLAELKWQHRFHRPVSSMIGMNRIMQFVYKSKIDSVVLQ